MPHPRPGLRARLPLTIALVLVAAPLAAQVPPDRQAEMLLASARKAHADKNYPFAADRFREFLQKFGGHPQANAARFGLALCLLDGPQRNYQAALDQLQPLAGARDFADQPAALYHLALVHRALGVAELDQARAKPNEAQQRRQAARQRFEEAAKHFAAAIPAFAARVKAPPAEGELPVDLEWSARARCDQAEMEVRLGRSREAQALTAPFLKDPLLGRSKFRGLGLYYHGYATFLLGDFVAAGRTLNQLAPFTDPVYGLHARFLLGRVFQQTAQFPEAAAAFEAVLADYEQQKKAAAQALQRPEQLKPDERARLEALARGPVPAHVAQAVFYSAALLYEAGRFGEALARFAAFAKDFPDSPLVPEAQLRVGYCQVQLKQYAEAQATLKPLADKHPRLADQALLWLGKAQASAADGKAANTLRQAAERAKQAADNGDPEGQQRRGEILLELADVLLTAKQAKDAAAVLEGLLDEKALPARTEELTQRLADAWHLAGEYGRSDQVCERFAKEFPRSPLLPAVLFRGAENAYFAALAAEQDAATGFDEAGKRYKGLVAKFPEFERAHLARFGLALALYRKGDFAAAQQALQEIPAPDRTGDLVVVSYLLADCLLRQAPAKADDALAAGKLQEQLTQAAQLLDGFVTAAPKAAEAPDALLKLGYCQQRLAALLAQPQDKANALGAARAAYERLMRQFPNDALVPQAVLERAKCRAAAGDKNGAARELRRFTGDPLWNAPVAPLAVIQYATYLRELNQAQEGATALNDCRQKHEPSLAKDPARVAWVGLLRYHQGVCLMEAGKLADARGLFDGVVAQAAEKPIAAEAALRGGQCRMLEARKALDAAQKRLAQAGKPEDRAAAQKQVDEALAAVRSVAGYLDQQAEAFKPALPTAEPRARMIYESAWASRMVAEAEVAAATEKLRQEQLKKLEEAAKKDLPPGNPPPRIAPPLVARTAVPLQPAEGKARASYQALIAGFPDLPLAVEARLELAELLAERAEHDEAIKQINEAIDKEPPQEVTDRLRLRLGVCLAGKKDYAGALGHFDTVLREPKKPDAKNPLTAQALLRSGECLLEMGKPADAVARLTWFRDAGPFQNSPGLTDRALLRLGQALAQQKQWDQSRHTLGVLVSRFGNSPWVLEGRYGIGWAYQSQKQYDQAVNEYAQVVNATVTVLGARAQLQIGLCRMEQKRFAEAATALLVVPFTYDYPELNPVALCEAARCLIETKQPEQAERLLQRVIREYPQSEWAAVARERLKALKVE